MPASAGTEILRDLKPLPRSLVQDLERAVPYARAFAGAFSTEIPTGYWRADGTRALFKGGSVSGDATEAFRRATFSRGVTTRAPYQGPAGVRPAALNIAGAQ